MKVGDFARGPPAARIPEERTGGGLPAPGGVADHAAEVAAGKCGSLSASTSAFTLPNVVSGLCLMRRRTPG